MIKRRVASNDLASKWKGNTVSKTAFDKWIEGITMLRDDIASRAEQPVNTDEAIHDCVILAIALAHWGVMEERSTGLAVTLIGYRFVAYVDVVKPDLAVWLVEMLANLCNANEAWKINGGSR